MTTNTTTMSTAAMLQHAVFKFQRLEEAQMLADYIAAACPNPRMIVVGITEILINAIEHGNLQISYNQKDKLQKSEQWLAEIERRLKLPENINKFVTLEFTKTMGNITLVVTDLGNGFDWQKYQTLDVDHVHDSHGRGIIMAKSLAFKELRYNPQGNQVTCVITV